MIREIIKFTEDLIADIPDIMQWKVEPSKGLHIIVGLDENGEWKNRLEYGINYYYYKGGDDDNNIISIILSYGAQGKRVGTTMNKVLDKKKQIFSCSPFIISFKKKSIENDKLDGSGIEKIIKLIPGYFESSRKTCLKEDTLIELSKSFEKSCISILRNIDMFTTSPDNEPIFNMMKDDEYVNIYFGNASTEEYTNAHDNYLKDKLFNDNSFNNEKDISASTYGLSNFLNGLNAKKPFLMHKTSCAYSGINGRIQAKDVKILDNFETLLNNGVFPNPLPIIIDKKELNNECVNIFNNNKGHLSYRELLNNLFAKNKINELPNYYLLNYTKRKTIIINDIDFVPLFIYSFNPVVKIFNLTNSGIIKEKEFYKEGEIRLNNIFDFERIVVREIFNNSLVKIKDDKYSTHYFDEIDPTYVSGGDIMYQQIMKYRKAFYDYIYKSKNNAINLIMFNDLMYKSILSNIHKDDIKGRFEWNNSIKKKINIWFSLYNLFNNNKNSEIMVSKVTDLLSKMRNVVKGESIFEKPEEFAFGAGQVVSYLIDRSIANDKTYALLEPFLQKTKSNLLQDAIAQTIAVYKHDISTYKGAFQALSSNVLTYDDNIDTKPLLKYFLAGCFSPCIIYDKKEVTTNKIGE
jgi:CRISPR-associated protein Csh1